MQYNKFHDNTFKLIEKVGQTDFRTTNMSPGRNSNLVFKSRMMLSFAQVILLYGASTTAKHCLPKDRRKVMNLSIWMVSFCISYGLQ